MSRKGLFLGFLLVAWPTVPPAHARQSNAYAALDWSAGGTENVNRVGMHGWWRPSTGLQARVATDWYSGFLEGGGRFLPLASRSAEVPSYHAVLVYAGWGRRWSPWRIVRLSVSVRAGMLRMTFDEETFAGVRTENELSTGFAGLIELFPVGRLGLFVEGTAERTFTSTPIDWLHASAGISVRTGTPRWLRRVLE